MYQCGECAELILRALTCPAVLHKAMRPGTGEMAVYFLAPSSDTADLTVCQIGILVISVSLTTGYFRRQRTFFARTTNAENTKAPGKGTGYFFDEPAPVNC